MCNCLFILFIYLLLSYIVLNICENKSCFSQHLIYFLRAYIVQFVQTFLSLCSFAKKIHRRAMWQFKGRYRGFHEKGTLGYLCALGIDRQSSLNECNGKCQRVQIQPAREVPTLIIYPPWLFLAPSREGITRGPTVPLNHFQVRFKQPKLQHSLLEMVQVTFPNFFLS